MRRLAGARWGFPCRSLAGGALLLTATITLTSACNSTTDEAALAFAKAVSEQNEQWIDQGERPLADLVQRLSNDPTTIAEHRDEVTAQLAPFAALLDGAIATVRALTPPGLLARACYDAQMERLESERQWFGELQTAITDMQDATAVAALQSFSDLKRTIDKADEACSKFVEGMN